MTVLDHFVTYTDEISPAGTTYYRSTCTCGLHDSIHLTHLAAGKAGTDHLRVVEQLAEQESQR